MNRELKHDLMNAEKNYPREVQVGIVATQNFDNKKRLQLSYKCIDGVGASSTLLRSTIRTDITTTTA